VCQCHGSAEPEPGRWFVVVVVIVVAAAVMVVVAASRSGSVASWIMALAFASGYCSNAFFFWSFLLREGGRGDLSWSKACVPYTF